ncbi:PP2C family serine/threonine-protein phosphatase [Gemmatimonas phototrophica]|uniref:PP2C family serine/threonine-protein phosphatase n=1 Tax=Gemmatimonas phototrophica TaxID=1379270 RepID=UPI0011AE2066|nr:PP2C family serine/threonine-protein phosphatase [Gemmatimonas phototrophica]
MNSDLSNLPDADSAAAERGGASGTAETGGPAAPPTAAAEPPRAIWNSVTPTAPWCPDEWRDHLDAVAPGLFTSGSAAAAHEATGVRMSADGWSLLLASRRGRLHAHRGEHREDAGHLVHFAGGWCAAVADGAGSATYSRLGSAIATFTVTHELRDAVQHGRAAREALGPAMRHAAQLVNDRMRDFAARVGIALRDLRTTLLVAAWHQGMLAVMQVGDGAIAIVHTDGALSHPFAAATGDFSGEVAHFLPDDGALDVLQSSLRTQPGDHVTGVLLASDGVEDPWYPFTRHARALVATLANGTTDTTPLPTALTPVFTDSVLQAADPVHALTEWLAFEKRGENDDRTLCMATAAALVTFPPAA